ncbi:MAG: hypothetical protein HOV83_41735 [Catenulispora sp.]|nr:hypothetical protein [Catenulispora sp.]
MTLTVVAFNAAVQRLHTAAEQAHQTIGIAQPVLMLVPEAGEPIYVLLPTGTPKTTAGRAELRRRAHEFGSVAAAISAESWFHVPSVRAEQLPAMPIADLPHPVEADPDARREAISTTALWPTAPDGPLGLQRTSIITRTAFGSVFTPDPRDQLVHSPGGGGLAAFLTNLLTP